MLHYCHTPEANFGDDLNPWLWPRLGPEVCDPRPDILFIGIGTLLNSKIPVEPLKTVFGAGWSGHRRPTIDSKWTVHCVRGPLTARGLSLDPGLAVTDPAILVRRFAENPVEKLHRVAFMPHHRSLGNADWAQL